MANRTYLGTSQSIASNDRGVLDRIGAYFRSGGTPAYIGGGQPPPTAGVSFFGGMSFFGGTTPAYRPPPFVPAEPPPTCAPPGPEAAPTACPIDPAALAAGQIAIVIPRLGL
ncbi:MAG TPA: hypothetical protein VNO30_21095 [Kofleriaceae bacterium]|nr:hypothetical protein [Kofleriaceae bacterium]